MITFFAKTEKDLTNRIVRYLIAGGALISVILPFILKDKFPVLYGEWIALTLIAIHLFMVAGNAEIFFNFSDNND